MMARSPPARLALIKASSLLLATGIWPESMAGVREVEVGMYSVFTSRPYLANWPVSSVTHSGALVTLMAVYGMVNCGSSLAAADALDAADGLAAGLAADDGFTATLPAAA